DREHGSDEADPQALTPTDLAFTGPATCDGFPRGHLGGVPARRGPSGGMKSLVMARASRPESWDQSRVSMAQRELRAPVARLPGASGERGEADVGRGCVRDVLL